MESIYADEKYYNRCFDIYKKMSNRFVLWLDWTDSFFANKVIKVLEESVPLSTESLRILGVGCGSGETDHELVSRLLTKFSKISNTVVEPTDAINKYKALVEVEPLPGVEYHWWQQTFDLHYQSILKPSKMPKFHFISVISVLYYIQNWEAAIMQMYNHLETGGVLMITLMSEESGFWRLKERFSMLADHLNVQIHTNHVKTFLRTQKIDFDVMERSGFVVDITCCSKDEDEEGSMLIDFISHVKNFKTTAPSKLQADFMNYLSSTECSYKDKDRVLFDNSMEAIIVRKS